MAHYLLLYQLSADYLQRRGEFRDAHLQLAWQLADQGLLLLGGAVGDPVESAMLLFQTDDQAQIAAFAAADPYVQQGLVTSWRIVPWLTVAGPLAATPLKSVAIAPADVS